MYPNHNQEFETRGPTVTYGLTDTDPCADIPEPDSFDAIVTVNEFAFGTEITSYAISSKSAVVYPVSPPPGNDVELNVK
jgi:hypothetical protein